MAIQHREKYCRCRSCRLKRLQEKWAQKHRSLERSANARKKRALQGQKSRNKKLNKVDGFLRKTVFGFDKNFVKPASKSLVSAGDQFFYTKRPRRKKIITRKKAITRRRIRH